MLIQTYNIRVTSYKIDTGSSTKITCKAMAQFTIYPSQEILTKIPELNREILLELDDKALGRMCETSKEAHDVCKDDLFWRERIIRVFDIDLTKYMDEESSYKDMYRFLNTFHAEIMDMKVFCAAKYGRLPILKYLIENIKYPVHRFCDTTFPVLLSNKSNNPTIIRYVIGKYPTNHLNKSLRQAADKGNLEFFKYLLEAGADFTTTGGNYSAKNSLDIAAMKGHLQIVRYIILNLKPTQKMINNGLSYAATYGQISILEYLLDKATDLDGLLNSAVLGDHIDTVKYLVENGAKNLDYALVISSRNGCLDIVKYLVSKGADNHYNNNEALSSAKTQREYKIVQYLQKLG